ncbi:MAG: RNA-binding domain-containing protein [Nitrospirota bacterium]
MDKKELGIILKEGEGYKVEFKEGLSNLDKEIVAFANASGGRVFLGITDDGKVKGISITNELKSRIQDIANNCKPKVKIIIDNFQNILFVNVREGDDKPYECSSGYYKRIGANSQKMTREEIRDIFQSEGKIRFDELIEPKFKYPKDFDINKLHKFLELAGLSKSVKKEVALVNLGVAEKQEGEFFLNKAGVLFLAKEPQRFIPWSVYTVALFKDKNGVDVIDRKEITGGLFEIVDQVMDFVRLYAKVAYRFTGRPQREEIYEYPFEAIREAVINSVMHKDYFEHGHNNILKFFPDRIQIENIWAKPRKFILGKTVFRRNQLIADLFSRIHFGERLGSGLQRMRDICKVDNAPNPKVEFTDTHFYIVFRQSNEYLKMAQKEKQGATDLSSLNQRQLNALDYLREKGKITNKEYVEINKISRETAKRDLSDLTEKGFLEIIGKGRSLYYVIGS